MEKTGFQKYLEAKKRYFPNGYKHSSHKCTDYRFTEKGQREFRRAAMLKAASLGV